MRSNEMDSSHGFLCDVHVVADENLEGVSHLPRHIRAQVASHRSSTAPMDVAHSARLQRLLGRMDSIRSTARRVHSHRPNDALHPVLVQLVGSQSRHRYVPDDDDAHPVV